MRCRLVRNRFSDRSVTLFSVGKISRVANLAYLTQPHETQFAHDQQISFTFHGNLNIDRLRCSMSKRANSLEYLSKGRDNNLNLIRMLAATMVLVSHSYVVCSGDPHSEPWLGLLGMTPGGLAVDAFLCWVVFW